MFLYNKVGSYLLIMEQNEISLILNSSLEVYNCSSQQDPFILFIKIQNINQVRFIKFQKKIIFHNNTFMLKSLIVSQTLFSN